MATVNTSPERLNAGGSVHTGLNSEQLVRFAEALVVRQPWPDEPTKAADTPLDDHGTSLKATRTKLLWTLSTIEANP